jgi:hypothetical protein
MGITAGLIRYPAEVFDDVKERGSFYPPNDTEIQHCFLDRSWDELHPALRTFGHPLSLALSGDYGYDGGLDRFGWNENDDSDHYLAFVSPSLTKSIAELLDSLSYDELTARIEDPCRGFEYMNKFFQEMVQFYRAAADEGNCVFIHVA